MGLETFKYNPTLFLYMCNIKFNGFYDTSEDNSNWTTITYDSTPLWYNCPHCNQLIQWWGKYCPQCGEQIIMDVEPTNKEIIEKLDTLIREINEIKAKLIK